MPMKNFFKKDRPKPSLPSPVPLFPTNHLNFIKKDGPKSTLAPPVPRLLKTNDPPNEREIATINAAIATAQSELDLILLGSRRTRVAQLAEFVRVHRAVLSPVRRVPFEVIVPILFHAFWDEAIDVVHPPCLLAHVCRLWRAVIKDTKILELATIPPPLRLTDGRSSNQKLRVVRVASNSPFSFNVLDHTQTEHHHALHALISGSNFWQCASLDLNISSLRFLDENLNPLSIRRLTKLDLKVASPFPFSCSAFRDALALTDVVIECDQKFLIMLPWKNLKSYRERSSFNIGVSRVLRIGTEIELLSYTTANPSPFVTGPSSSTLPRLKVLDIKIYHDDHTVALQLTTPILEEFVFRDHGHGSIYRLQTHLDRSRCGHTLKRLAFHVGMSLKVDILSQMLGSLPNLEELECDDIPLNDLERLGREEPRKLVPRLRALIVHQSSNAGGIDNLITSRSQFQPTEHTLLGSKKAGLHRVSLVFSEPKDCDAAAIALRIQDPSPRNELIGMRQAITQIDLLCKSGLAKMSDDQAKDLTKALSKLETFELQNAREIDLRAVNTVKRLWWLSESGPLEAKYRFTQRARTLWDVWRTILLTRIRQANATRWIRDESNSLLYLKAVQEDRKAFERDLLSVQWQGFQASCSYAID